ncbi:trans-sulfuration enzyme family protein [Aurantiacibacter sediminis]|uniref:Aminotransferase class I/II-fold pyridoxal phosphate-dependent enzyme n=1 Tax=Aurantiacibacter sediminis TaxID=2793064 RepID=A0ABS0N2H6_9SPHN|nr:aminotransferase class I/II-fold pyridoxal phosphate-dependent enzyme [Aurantiacibacter sediminis]MBH5322171.1 aminotransferase class I/II-fold pyridoxal phosphate-dependent enzyme [Aurantiacibacter sediminis]
MKKRTGTDPATTGKWRAATQAVRAGTHRSEHGETSEALYLTSGFTYDSAEEVAARFAGEADGMQYSRFKNPTVEMAQQRIAAMEGAEACLMQASGMAAMTSSLLCMLSQGDHVVAGRAAFGSCRWILDNVLNRFGITHTAIDGTDNAAWEAAVQPNTKAFFFETPANPTMDLVDLEFVCGLAKAKGITTVVDNAFATSVLQKPMKFGADVVAYSATKLMDGQGRVMAGAVCSSREWIEEYLSPFQRNTGPIVAPFNAWVVMKGLETLPLRAPAQSKNALQVAQFLEEKGLRVLHPDLASHPQHALAQKQMLAAGPIFAFFTPDGQEQAMALCNALELIDISNNIGDSKTLMCHPASTTHYNMGAEGRAEAGIADGMLRINVGLEDPLDLIEDLDRALGKIGL